jgi:hypothetical protein
MPFPTPSAIGDAVQGLLQGDSVTSTVQWFRGRGIIDDPLTDPSVQDVTSGYIFVNRYRGEPAFMGGLNAAGQNISQWRARVDVTVVCLSRDPAKDTQAAARAAESISRDVERALLAGDQTLGGLTLLVLEAAFSFDSIPREGAAWATLDFTYEYIASPA